MIWVKLIVGGDKEKRLKLAYQIAKQNMGKSFSSTHPDFLLIEGVNSISIDQVREFEKYLFLKPYQANIKIALINEAEKLTLPAQNALLKTLEEPPGNSLILLAATKINALLPTVVSRCQIINLPQESEILLDEKEKSHYLRLLNAIAKSRLGERLKMADTYGYAQDKNRAIKFIQVLLLTGRERLLKDPSLDQARHLRNIQSALTILEANVNPGLVLGNLLLNLV